MAVEVGDKVTLIGGGAAIDANKVDGSSSSDNALPAKTIAKSAPLSYVRIDETGEYLEASSDGVGGIQGPPGPAGVPGGYGPTGDDGNDGGNGFDGVDGDSDGDNFLYYDFTDRFAAASPTDQVPRTISHKVSTDQYLDLSIDNSDLNPTVVPEWQSAHVYAAGRNVLIGASPDYTYFTCKERHTSSGGSQPQDSGAATSWASGESYISDAIVWHAGTYWSCILGHTAGTASEPQYGVDTATYWVQDADNWNRYWYTITRDENLMISVNVNGFLHGLDRNVAASDSDDRPKTLFNKIISANSDLLTITVSDEFDVSDYSEWILDTYSPGDVVNMTEGEHDFSPLNDIWEWGTYVCIKTSTLLREVPGNPGHTQAYIDAGRISYPNPFKDWRRYWYKIGTDEKVVITPVADALKNLVPLCMGVTFPGAVDPVNHWFGYNIQEDISISEANIDARVWPLYTSTGTFSIWGEDGGTQIGTITFSSGSQNGVVDLTTNPTVLNVGDQFWIGCDGADDTGAFVVVSVKATRV